MTEDSPNNSSRQSTGAVALIGQPNSGKSSLYNLLTTGVRAKVANYAGATVEFSSALLDHPSQRPVIDLPGLYELVGGGADEAVTVATLLGLNAAARPTSAVVVVDATTIERGLRLVKRMADLGLPFIVALNMADLVEQEGLAIDIEALARCCGAPVIAVSARTGDGISHLKQAIVALPDNDVWQQSVAARQLLERASEAQPALWSQHQKYIAGLPVGTDSYASIQDTLHQWLDASVRRVGEAKARALTDRIDDVLLHPVAGISVFLAAMLLVFQSVYLWSEPFVEWIEWGLEAIGTVAAEQLPAGASMFVQDVLLGGVGNVIVFIPQIVILFAWISILEQSGYLARVSFLLDGLMRRAGLSGSSFIPLLSSHACAVPGIMAARSIADPTIRLVTVLVAPLMTCSARLPVYVLVIGALFPDRTVMGISLQGLVLFSLYALGVLGALVLAKMLHKRVHRGRPIPMILDLPLYRRPRLRIIAETMASRALLFLRRAGTIIFTLSAAMWFLLQAGWQDGHVVLGEELETRNSMAGYVGRGLEPVLQPMGFDWKIGVGLVASFAAREMMVATLGTIYNVEDADETSDTLRTALQQDPVWDIPTATALLVWYVFALQCLSTVAIMRRELGGWRWPVAALASTYGLSWILATLTYQIGSRLL